MWVKRLLPLKKKKNLYKDTASRPKRPFVYRALQKVHPHVCSKDPWHVQKGSSHSKNLLIYLGDPLPSL